MSGSASFNPSYEVAPMRQPLGKSKDSLLSADAPEFVPSFQKKPSHGGADSGNVAGVPMLHQPDLHHPVMQPQPMHHGGHRHNQQGQMMNHNAYRNNHMPHHQYNQYNNHHHSQPNQKSSYSVNQRMYNNVPRNQPQPIHHNNYQVNHQHHNQHQHHQHQHHQQQQQHQHQHQPPHQQNHHNHNQHSMVPHIQQQMMHIHQQLGQMNISKPNEETPAFEQNAQADADSGEPSEAAMNALSFIIEIIEKLMSDPGKFENYQKELTTLYIDHADNQHVVSNAIELFFNHSIEEQNFRYTGARLCRLLDSIDPSSSSLFRRLLCCKLQYNDTELIQYMNDNETHKVRNTTLFLAELYIQLQNDGSRITNIANSIHRAISLLMPKLSPENIKCVCQTLKLCGYELDIDFPKETEELMAQLSSCENTDVSTQRLLSSVVELRKNRWGRSDMNSASNPLLVEQQPSGKEYSNDPVFYGPDGKILSEEESAFLWGATQPSNDYYDEEEDNDDALVEPEPEMDLEIQLAFKEFVTYQNKK